VIVHQAARQLSLAMRIPRKTELIRLQALYKTDARIAEALGGIPEYLVTYWRRKKKIPRHTSTKFTQQQIQELWERFGDDFRAGRELNISKAAFYTWRQVRPCRKTQRIATGTIAAAPGRAAAASRPIRDRAARTNRQCQDHAAQSGQPPRWESRLRLDRA
jgi:hypothetical protein